MGGRTTAVGSKAAPRCARRETLMTVAAAPVMHYRARGTLQAIAAYRSIPLESERVPVVFALHQLPPNHGVRPENYFDLERPTGLRRLEHWRATTTLSTSVVRVQSFSDRWPKIMSRRPRVSRRRITNDSLPRDDASIWEYRIG